MTYNRTAEAQALLADIEGWCARTGTPETALGHALFLHPGFVGLLRKRLTLTVDKEIAVRAFIFHDHVDGYRGPLEKTHANGSRPVQRGEMAKLTDGVPARMSSPPAFLTVDRDPCPRCGVRGDFGCSHNRAPLGTSF